MHAQIPSRRRAVTVLRWAATVIVVLGIGLAGADKFIHPAHWQHLFAGWGYPARLSLVIGVLEIGGALGLLVRRVALPSAVLLAVVMAGALLTLLFHRHGPMGSGMTPAFYLALLGAIIAIRRGEAAAS